MKKRFWFIAGVLIVVLAIQLKNAIFIDYKVEGISMNPTFKQGNELMVNKFSHRYKTIRRFDIVLFKGPHRKVLIKRVIGLPGESLAYREDQLYVNGKRVAEPFLKPLKSSLSAGSHVTGDYTLKETTGRKSIPKGQYFVIGDNRIYSLDSRHFGPIKDKDIVGVISESDAK
ncbi:MULTISPECIES: signal peptidase I [Bacillus]|uniref:signal peptidase I n=1 Tax=Bacillus TaxID=1386 RepID=UPI0003D648C5|nr:MULTISPECIES: signal peptidase I [Bacillus]AHC41571.1 signal peptidase [Bacillus amyloliquefaciens LFB112]AKD29211.1 Signal peptidase I [Bacillus velezensis NJN-6]MBB4872767.1 signal peptidase I [Bacillus velezensis]MBE1278830.1 signal peptidase I [Bacillus sp. Bvel1]MBW8601413.1 signal peptidase I [Bacillus amyloliquefaciens]